VTQVLKSLKREDFRYFLSLNNFAWPFGAIAFMMSCMRTIQVKYPTITRTKKIGNKVYVVEAIRDLDEAIDLICKAMTPDEQLDPFAEDLCPYFGILWEAAISLSEFLAENPKLVSNKKVLELGCGLGLPSLVATNLGADVLATDFHPDVEEYFQRNCRHSSVECKYLRLNWREENVQEKFDVVIGSDVLYESKHPKEVALGLLRFVKDGGTIILSDPGRSYLQQFLSAMKELGVKEEMFSKTVNSKEVLIFKFTECVEQNSKGKQSK
jgi:predicted nicotinamide N-methyase